MDHPGIHFRMWLAQDSYPSNLFTYCQKKKKKVPITGPGVDVHTIYIYICIYTFHVDVDQHPPMTSMTNEITATVTSSFQVDLRAPTEDNNFLLSRSCRVWSNTGLFWGGEAGQGNPEKLNCWGVFQRWAVVYNQARKYVTNRATSCLQSRTR